MIEGSAIGLIAAFSAGIVSFLSPCVLPLVPAYVSYVAGQPLHAPAPGIDTRARATAAVMSLFFVLGFSTVFIALGANEAGALFTARLSAGSISGVPQARCRAPTSQRPVPGRGARRIQNRTLTREGPA